MSMKSTSPFATRSPWCRVLVRLGRAVRGPDIVWGHHRGARGVGVRDRRARPAAPAQAGAAARVTRPARLSAPPRT